MGMARSHVIDDGQTRIVAVVEGTRAVIHATKYSKQETALVTASMRRSDAYALGLWLIDNAK